MSAAEATIENMAMIAALKRCATQIGYDDDFFLNLPGFGCQVPGARLLASSRGSKGAQ
jgi:hypothetical protein